MNLPDGFDDLVESISSDRNGLLGMMAADLGYTHEDCQWLWDDYYHFVSGLPGALAGVIAARETVRNRVRRTYRGADQVWLPWGKVLFCPASNALIPILPCTLMCLLLAGNQVVVAPSRRMLPLTESLLGHFELCVPSWSGRFSVFREGVREACRGALDDSGVKLLWVQGSSVFREDLLTRCLHKGRDYIFEGSGNSVVVIDPDISNTSVEIAVEMIASALHRCLRTLCTSPSLIFVPRPVFTYVKAQIGKAGGIEAVEIEQIPEEWMTAPESEVGIHMVCYDRVDQVLEALATYRFGIQIAVFTENDRERVLKDWGSIVVSRILINTEPTFQRTSLPWGGYQASGPSPVVDLIEKASRSVVIQE